MKKLLLYAVLLMVLVPWLGFSSDVFEIVVIGVPTETCQETLRNILIRNINKSTTIGDLKVLISKDFGLKVESQQLFFSGKEYDDGTTLDSIPGLMDDSRLLMQIRYIPPAKA